MQYFIYIMYCTCIYVYNVFNVYIPMYFYVIYKIDFI